MEAETTRLIIRVDLFVLVACWAFKNSFVFFVKSAGVETGKDARNNAQIKAVKWVNRVDRA